MVAGRVKRLASSRAAPSWPAPMLAEITSTRVGSPGRTGGRRSRRLRTTGQRSVPVPAGREPREGGPMSTAGQERPGGDHTTGPSGDAPGTLRGPIRGSARQPAGSVLWRVRPTGPAASFGSTKTLPPGGLPCSCRWRSATFSIGRSPSYRDRPAVIDEPGVPGSLGTLTYGELDARARGMALALEELDVGFGERVAIVSPNAARFQIAFFGVSGYGRVLVPDQLPARTGRDPLRRRALRRDRAARRPGVRCRLGRRHRQAPHRPGRSRRRPALRACPPGSRAPALGARRSCHRQHQLHERNDRPA